MREVTIDDMATALDQGVTVVDVREPAEHAQGRVPGVLPIPMGQLPGRLHELDRESPVYVVCASGGRSSAMTEVLTAAGFEAASVAGGTNAWINAGRPVERG